MARQAPLTIAPRTWTAKELTELAKRVAAGGNLSLAAFICPDFRKYHPDAIVHTSPEARAMLEGIEPR